MIDKFPAIRHDDCQEHGVQILDGMRPKAGSNTPPTLSILVETGDNPPVLITASYERWPRIMTEIVRKLAEGRGATASFILDEMDASLFDGDGKLKP